MNENGTFSFSLESLTIDLSETLRRYVPMKLPLRLTQCSVASGRMTIVLDMKRLNVQDSNEYRAEDRLQQFINIMLVGMILALMIYSFILSFLKLNI